MAGNLLTLLSDVLIVKVEALTLNIHSILVSDLVTNSIFIGARMVEE